MSLNEEALIQEIQSGIPLVSRPFGEIASRLKTDEEQVIQAVRGLIERGTIRRFGTVIKHRELGYSANAMCVWDIPDERVRMLGERMQKYPFVTLCYRRRRSLPAWPYNLFCMIHGKSRDEVLAQREQLVRELELVEMPSRVLFSGKCFKQRGAKWMALADRELLKELQNGIPVGERPFLSMAQALRLTEEEVVQKVRGWLADGTLSRFGPMYNVEKFGGTFVLAAMEVPRERFAEVNELVNAYAEVAHNYEREHRLNMWFVVATETPERNLEVIQDIENRTGLKVFSLPKEKEFFLELKLDL